MRGYSRTLSTQQRRKRRSGCFDRFRAFTCEADAGNVYDVLDREQPTDTKEIA